MSRNFAAAFLGSHLLGDGKVDSIIERGAEVAVFCRADFREAAVPFVELVDAVEESAAVGGPVRDEAEMIAKADGEGAVGGLDDFFQEGLDGFLVLLDELVLAAAFVDDDADAERKLTLLCEGNGWFVGRRLR